MSDIKIAQQAAMLPIADLAASKLGIAAEDLDAYGKYKAKISLTHINNLPKRPLAKLILLTAISPTPAGEGKTTTTIGLCDALNLLGKTSIACLREPSLGPCFGLKGGAAGGGYAQVVPMEDINLHFTGDFHAVGAAHNLLAAMLDNHLQHGNALQIDLANIHWRRTVDMNDRALRNITIAQGVSDGVQRQDGYDIVVASEVMAILCLADGIADLKQRLGRIVVADKQNGDPVYASDLQASGAMAALLKDAIKPNIVQTLENNIAIIHGGPFANIAHGCNSVLATKTAMKLSDYTVTEAGFGADLGAEKFVDIKCRMSGLAPDAAVLVATVRALKFHGGVAVAELGYENLPALERGFANLQRHFVNITQHYGVGCVVCINHFATDTTAEIELLQQKCANIDAKCVLAKHWQQGGKGALPLAQAVLEATQSPSKFTYVYEDALPLWDKIFAVCKLYGAKDIVASDKVRAQIAKLQENYGTFPVCIAKTQMSFSTDPTAKGAPSNHTFAINSVRLANGAGFIVVIAGAILTMPGLPKTPAAERINISDDGKISGLF